MFTIAYIDRIRVTAKEQPVLPIPGFKGSGYRIDFKPLVSVDYEEPETIVFKQESEANHFISVLQSYVDGSCGSLGALYDEYDVTDVTFAQFKKNIESIFFERVDKNQTRVAGGFETRVSSLKVIEYSPNEQEKITYLNWGSQSAEDFIVSLGTGYIIVS